QDATLRECIRDDYREAADTYGIFGTPTLLFQGGEPVFLKMGPPIEKQALQFFDDLQDLAVGMPEVREIKKPRKPD
ncbi:MAG: DsbA family protein, partial [Chloroflexota bacterium]